MMNFKNYIACRALLLLTVFISVSTVSFAQGFFKEYPDLFNGVRSAERILELPGGGYILPTSDAYVDFFLNNNMAYLITDAQGNQVLLDQVQVPIWGTTTATVTNDGNILLADTTLNPSTPGAHNLKLRWQNFSNQLLLELHYQIAPGWGYIGKGKLISDDGGNIFLAAPCINASNQIMVFLLKFDALGNVIWNFPLNGTQISTWNLSVSQLVIGAGESSILLDYTDGLNVQHLYYQNLTSNLEMESHSFPITPLHSMAGAADGSFVIMNGMNITAFGANTSTLWTLDLPTLLNETPNIVSHYLMKVTNGWLGVILSGVNGVTVFRIDTNGNLLWKKPVSQMPFGLNSLTAGRELSDGSILLSGNYFELPFLLKLNPNGSIYPHKIVGQINNDLNTDCALSAGEPPLKQRVVAASRLSDNETVYGLTDVNGHYQIADVDTGAYVIQPVQLTYQWQVCETPDTAYFLNYSPALTDTANFLIKALFHCPLFWTNISTDRVAVCRQSRYALKYCNTGTQTATDASVEVIFPESFTIDSASASFTLVGPNTLRFEVGDMPIDSCADIYIYATLDCDPELAGQTKCVQSFGFPDSLCTNASTPWSGADIRVHGACDSDSVRFEIHNLGNGPMNAPLDFVIVEDHVISVQGDFQLLAGDVKTISVPKNGSTWRIEAEQEPNHPLGSAAASIALEGCALVGSPFSVGMVNLFANTNGNLLSSTDCHVVLNAYDPNEKQAFPIGLHEEHLIEANTYLDYQLNFQNTGNAPAQTVVLMDTLSAFLNPASIRMGASSHPYTWKLSGNGILRIRFDDIELPDSTTNEPASHGFVQFRINQAPDNPVGSVITNQAGIYFDVNPVVMTNQVFHTIGKDFIETVDVRSPEGVESRVLVFPNPADETARIELVGVPVTACTFRLFNSQGQVVRLETGENNVWLFHRNQLDAGLYFFSIDTASGGNMASGKLILR
ncbi:MAG: T9SS type A sorting domain-containing protein [Saprospiraceae bacterium]|nr:T9SS type A sorting domain-containing protein [Saprospiraceae bacterium]